jgi:hypothetical protein
MKNPYRPLSLLSGFLIWAAQAVLVIGFIGAWHEMAYTDPGVGDHPYFGLGIVVLLAASVTALIMAFLGYLGRALIDMALVQQDKHTLTQLSGKNQ